MQVIGDSICRYPGADRCQYRCRSQVDNRRSSVYHALVVSCRKSALPTSPLPSVPARAVEPTAVSLLRPSPVGSRDRASCVMFFDVRQRGQISVQHSQNLSRHGRQCRTKAIGSLLQDKSRTPSSCGIEAVDAKAPLSRIVKYHELRRRADCRQISVGRRSSPTCESRRTIASAAQ